jgi:hypothetical protein
MEVLRIAINIIDDMNLVIQKKVTYFFSEEILLYLVEMSHVQQND